MPTTSGTASTTFSLNDTPSATTLTLTGFSPPTGPTAGGNTVTLTGTNFTTITGVSFGGTAAATFGVITSGSTTVLTATAPAHAAGTVDISVTTGSGGSAQTATIHGYTYLASGSINPAPGVHAPPGSTSGTAPMVQPARHAAPGSTLAPSVAAVASNAITPTTPTPTPDAARERR